MTAPDREDTEDTVFLSYRQGLIRSLQSQIGDRRVLEAMSRVPRQRFVDSKLSDAAYDDRPLPIGHGQTTSQPLMIAIMLQEMALVGTEKVLEVGAGSGYQTALLAELANEVVGVELIPSLLQKAFLVLAELDYSNVSLHLAGEELGWPEGAPYDAIVVAAAAPRVPVSLVDQLAEAGRLVIPVGRREGQDLLLVEKTAAGVTVTRKGGCGFVPLIGKEAFGASGREASR